MTIHKDIVVQGIKNISDPDFLHSLSDHPDDEVVKSIIYNPHVGQHTLDKLLSRFTLDNNYSPSEVKSVRNAIIRRTRNPETHHRIADAGDHDSFELLNNPFIDSSVVDKLANSKHPRVRELVQAYQELPAKYKIDRVGKMPVGLYGQTMDMIHSTRGHDTYSSPAMLRSLGVFAGDTLPDNRGDYWLNLDSLSKRLVRGATDSVALGDKDILHPYNDDHDVHLAQRIISNPSSSLLSHHILFNHPNEGLRNYIRRNSTHYRNDRPNVWRADTPTDVIAARDREFLGKPVGRY